MDPLWNSLVIAGLQPVPNGPAKPFLGFVGMLGTHYDDQHVATGIPWLSCVPGPILCIMPCLETRHPKHCSFHRMRLMPSGVINSFALVPYDVSLQCIGGVCGKKQLKFYTVAFLHDFGSVFLRTFLDTLLIRTNICGASLHKLYSQAFRRALLQDC